MTVPADPSSPPPRGIAALRSYLGGEALLPLGVLFALNAVDEFDTRLFEVLGPDVADHFGIGVGAFTAIAVLAAIIVPLVALPIAHRADRHARMPLAIGGAVAWGSFSVLTGIAPALAVLIIARAGSNMGKVVNGPVHGGLIGDFYSPRVRTKIFGVHSLANPIGGVVAAVVGGVLAERYGWRLPFLLFGIPTALVVVWATRLREPERGRFELVEAPEAPAFRDAVTRLWSHRSLRYQWIGAAWTGGAVFGIGIMLPFFLEEEFGIEAAGRGLLNGIGQVVGVIATIAGTTLMQQRINVRPSDGLRLLCRIGAVAAVGLLACAAAPNVFLFAVPMFVVIGIFAFVVPGLLSVTAVVAPPELRAMGFALGGVVALAGLPLALIAALIGNSSLRWATVVMVPVFLRGIGYFLQATRYVDDDIARLDPAARRAAAAGVRADRAGADGRPILLETQGITVSYSGVQVLFGIDLEIRQGEILALLGTNGSGKSTTLNAISGLVTSDSGNVFFEGHAITGEPPERTAARGIIQVPGGKGIFPGLTVEENLAMGGFMIRRDRATLAERTAEVLELFPRLAERRTQKAGDMSGGERQMLTLAQSFLLHPKLLLIDELSLGLAPSVVGDLLTSVRAMSATGTTIVLVEQSVNVALTLAERAYFLEKGEVRFSGLTADLLERADLLRSVFLEGASAATTAPAVTTAPAATTAPAVTATTPSTEDVS